MKFFTNNKDTVVAVSSYAQRPVRGVAKCSPEDTFDLTKGMAIAAARCNKKVAEKRLNRSLNKYWGAYADLEVAKARFDKMCKYYTDSFEALKQANIDLEETLKNL